jgi:EAL and modified HD-GYP domain-containing signal transduction protein
LTNLEQPAQPTESTDIFIGRQPIIDRNERVVAYELLFRGSATASFAQFDDPRTASFRVIANTFACMGAAEVLGTHRGFINATSEVIFSDILQALPADRVVIELFEDIPVTPELVERCSTLKNSGLQLALDDWVDGDPREELLSCVQMVKVDLQGLLPRVCLASASRSEETSTLPCKFAG